MSGQKDPRSKDPPPDYAEPEQDEKARPSAPRESAYPTYKPTWRLSLVELIALIVMGLLLGMSPRSAKGASAIIRSDGGNYGVLRSCAGGTCSWMGGSSSSSSSSNSSSNPTGHSLRNRDGSSLSPIPSNFYDTTGLAALCSAWILLYTFLFTVLRGNPFRFLPLFDDEPAHPEDKDVDQDCRQWFKRYMHATCRRFVILNPIIVFGVAVKCSILAWKAHSSKNGGVGTGIGLLWLELGFLVYPIWGEYFTKSKSAKKKLIPSKRRGYEDGEKSPEMR